MTEGYFAPTPGIYGTPPQPEPAIGGVGPYLPTDPDPVSRAALQEAAAAYNASITTNPGYVPPNMGYGPPSPNWSTGPGGPGNIPKIGWTCQKDAGTPAFPPYSTEDIGSIPDWTSDVNPAGGGQADMNQVLPTMAGNPLGIAPVGEGLLQFEDDLSPNSTGYDVGGDIGGNIEY